MPIWACALSVLYLGIGLWFLFSIPSYNIAQRVFLVVLWPVFLLIGLFMEGR